MRTAGLALSTEKEAWHTPPADAIFLHRKLGGLYLLAARLKARVDFPPTAGTARAAPRAGGDTAALTRPVGSRG